jgi:thioesterase domain-containing protein
MRRRFYTILRAGTKTLVRVAGNTEIVPLQASGSAPSFFMIDSFPYFIEVVKLLGQGQPVMSLIGYEELVIAGHYSIADEAAKHVRTILKHQPAGPYVLGGCSASGIVAYEAAQQMNALGHEIALLILFDTPNPHYMREYSSLRMSVNSYRADLHRLELREIPRWTGMKIKGLVNREISWLQHVLLRTESRKDEIGPSEIRIRAARKYRPAPYLGDVLLFKRHREFVGRYLNPQFGWSGVVRGGLEICSVEAIDHLEIFKTEIDRAVVARKLSQRFNETIGQNDFMVDGNRSFANQGRTG